MVIFQKKKYGVLFYNLRCNYCGNDNFVPKKWLLLKLILFKGVKHQCPKCMMLSYYRLIPHIVHDLIKEEKEFNKEITEHIREMRIYL